MISYDEDAESMIQKETSHDKSINEQIKNDVKGMYTKVIVNHQNQS